jgi:hypothetical protein
MSTLAAIPSVRSAVGTTAPLATHKARAAALVDTATRVSNNATDMRLPPPSAPRTSTSVSAGARSFAQSITSVNHMDVSQLGDDSLTAAFLKLNISDPNENVATHNALYDAASNLRQLALDEAQKQNDRVEELQHEATKYAAATTMLTGVMKITEKLGAALIPVNACVAAVLTGAASAAVSALDYKNKQKGLAVREAQNVAARIRVRADEEQTTIQNEGDIVNTIMETKNAVVDAVMKMVEQRGVTAQQLLSASMAR